jgi:hypothetical protein
MILNLIQYYLNNNFVWLGLDSSKSMSKSSSKKIPISNMHRSSSVNVLNQVCK